MLNGWHYLRLCLTLDVSRAASYEITLVRLSVPLSVRPSVTKFSQDWTLVFSDIVHDDS